jgi:hypothetical protein
MEIWIPVWIISIIITCWIARKKGQGTLGFFLGCFWGPLGILFALGSSSKNHLKKEKLHKSVRNPTAEEYSYDKIISPEPIDCRQNIDKSETTYSNEKSYQSMRFFFQSILWSTFTFLIAMEFATNQFWIVVLSVFLFGLPIALCGVYASTIRQIRRLHIFANRGRLYRLFSGRPLKVILWAFWALLTSFFMLVQFHTYGYLDWFIFFLIIPVFWFVFTVLRKVIGHEIKPYLITSMALSWSRRLCPVLMLVGYVFLNLYFGETTDYPSLEAAIGAKKAAVADMTGSALVFEVSQYSAFYDGVKAYALGRLGALDALWQLVVFSLGSLVVFYNACAILSCFVIPGMEYRRVFGPLSDADQPPPVPLSRMAAISAVAAFLTLFIYLPLFCTMEMWVRQTPEMVEVRQNAETWVIQKVEKIGDEFFREGTILQIEKAKVEALRHVEVSLTRLEGQADRAFDRLEGNVDVYLDWYYSLVGEYARIANLLVGDLEDYMTEKLEECLQQGDAFQEVEASLNRALSEYKGAQKVYQQARKRIMNENRVTTDGSPFQVVQKMSLKDVLNPPIHQDMIRLESRLIAGGGAGVVAGTVTTVVIKKVIAKVMGKNVVKLAAKALSKVVVGKAAGSVGGAGMGATVGAAIGSVIPFVGTAAGAIIGGILGGIAVGVSVDKLLIELEEAVNREEFKQEILSAINEARNEFKANLRG